MQPADVNFEQVDQKKKKKKKNKKKVKKTGENAPAQQNEDSGEDYSDTQCERQTEYRKGGYHPVMVGELYNSRYRIVRKLGWGYFSTVWLVWDNVDLTFKALKVQKSAQHYREAALDELKLLSEIRNGDLDGKKCCARLFDHFEHSGPHGKHVCLVFEVLGKNLLSLITRFKYKGIPIPVVKHLTRQILVGLDYLHRELSILHTDLKPENVLLEQPTQSVLQAMKDFVPPSDPGCQLPLAERDPSTLTRAQKKRLRRKNKDAKDDKQEEEEAEEKAEAEGDAGQGPKCQYVPVRDEDEEDDISNFDIKLADFGNGCWTYKQFTDEVQTRQYRAPEVIVGNGYSTPIDLWSLACMIFELITGDFLFDPKPSEMFDRDEDHLALMMELLGPMPDSFSLGFGRYRGNYFDPQGNLLHIQQLKFWPLESVLTDKYNFTEKKAAEIAEFPLPMLVFDPSERATAQEMLAHPWLETQPDDFVPHCYKGIVPQKDPGDESEEVSEDELQELNDLEIVHS